MTREDLLQTPLLALAGQADVVADQCELIHNVGPEGVLGTEITPMARLISNLGKLFAIVGFLVNEGMFDAEEVELATMNHATEIHNLVHKE